MSKVKSDQNGNASAGEQLPRSQITLQKLFVKDLSFESPNSPEVFRKPWKPRHRLDLNCRFHSLGDGLFEVVLAVSIEARDEAEDKVGFIVELQQAGVFAVTGLADAELRQALSTWAPTILFPYAREAIDSLVVRGAFPALMLAPVNFDALYQQALQQQAAEGGSVATDGSITH